MYSELGRSECTYSNVSCVGIRIVHVFGMYCVRAVRIHATIHNDTCIEGKLSLFRGKTVPRPSLTGYSLYTKRKLGYIRLTFSSSASFESVVSDASPLVPAIRSLRIYGSSPTGSQQFTPRITRPTVKDEANLATGPIIRRPYVTGTGDRGPRASRIPACPCRLGMPLT